MVQPGHGTQLISEVMDAPPVYQHRPAQRRIYPDSEEGKRESMPEDTALSLVGFMAESEARIYLRNVCRLTPNQRTDENLTAAWKIAQERLGDPIPRAGYPDIQPIPEEYHNHLEAVTAHPRFANPFDGMDVDWALVEIDPLLAYQYHVWLDHAADLVANVPNNPPFDVILERCLPQRIQPISPDIEVRRGDRPGYATIIVKDLDIVTRPLAISAGADPSAHLLGWKQLRKLPYVVVVRFNGRCYARNGFHRMYGLRARGVTRVPCIFLEAQTPRQVGIVPGETFELELLESANPPTVAHFTTGRAMRISLQRYAHIISVHDEGLQPYP